MEALARVVSNLSRTEIDLETLKTLVIFCGVGLSLSLLCLTTYGLDLSGGF